MRRTLTKTVSAVLLLTFISSQTTAQPVTFGDSPKVSLKFPTVKTLAAAKVPAIRAELRKRLEAIPTSIDAKPAQGLNTGKARGELRSSNRSFGIDSQDPRYEKSWLRKYNITESHIKKAVEQAISGAHDALLIVKLPVPIPLTSHSGSLMVRWVPSALELQVSYLFAGKESPPLAFFKVISGFVVDSMNLPPAQTVRSELREEPAWPKTWEGERISDEDLRDAVAYVKALYPDFDLNNRVLGNAASWQEGNISYLINLALKFVKPGSVWFDVSTGSGTSAIPFDQVLRDAKIPITLILTDLLASWFSLAVKWFRGRSDVKPYLRFDAATRQVTPLAELLPPGIKADGILSGSTLHLIAPKALLGALQDMNHALSDGGHLVFNTGDFDVPHSGAALLHDPYRRLRELIHEDSDYKLALKQLDAAARQRAEKVAGNVFLKPHSLDMVREALAQSGFIQESIELRDIDMSWSDALSFIMVPRLTGIAEGYGDYARRIQIILKYFQQVKNEMIKAGTADDKNYRSTWTFGVFKKLGQNQVDAGFQKVLTELIREGAQGFTFDESFIKRVSEAINLRNNGWLVWAQEYQVLEAIRNYNWNQENPFRIRLLDRTEKKFSFVKRAHRDIQITSDFDLPGIRKAGLDVARREIINAIGNFSETGIDPAGTKTFFPSASPLKGLRFELIPIREGESELINFIVWDQNDKAIYQGRAVVAALPRSELRSDAVEGNLVTGSNGLSRWTVVKALVSGFAVLGLGILGFVLNQPVLEPIRQFVRPLFSLFEHTGISPERATNFSESVLSFSFFWALTSGVFGQWIAGRGILIKQMLGSLQVGFKNAVITYFSYLLINSIIPGDAVYSPVPAFLLAGTSSVVFIWYFLPKKVRITGYLLSLSSLSLMSLNHVSLNTLAVMGPRVLSTFILVYIRQTLEARMVENVRGKAAANKKDRDDAKLSHEKKHESFTMTRVFSLLKNSFVMSITNVFRMFSELFPELTWLKTMANQNPEMLQTLAEGILTQFFQIFYGTSNVKKGFWIKDPDKRKNRAYVIWYWPFIWGFDKMRNRFYRTPHAPVAVTNISDRSSRSELRSNDNNVSELEFVDPAVSSIVDAYSQYNRVLREINVRAEQVFRNRDWPLMINDAQKRLGLYKESVDALERALAESLGARMNDIPTWQLIKASHFMRINAHHNVPFEMTFFNSIARRFLGREISQVMYGSTDIIRAESGDKSEEPIYNTFAYQNDSADLMRRLLLGYGFNKEAYADFESSVQLVVLKMNQYIENAFASTQFHSIQMLKPVFYRNKGAYLIGKLLVGPSERGALEIPFVVRLGNDTNGIYVDNVFLQESLAGNIFSFSRASFLILTDQPKGIAQFVHSLVPRKDIYEIYWALGYYNHARTKFYEHFEHHIHHTGEKFQHTKGISGTVMIAFSLPTFDNVFKVIRDRYGVQTKGDLVDKDLVKRRYEFVRRTDRAGRLLDAMSFGDFKIEKRLFSDELLKDLLENAGETVLSEGDYVVIKHFYVQKKLTPLDVYLSTERDPEKLKAVIIDYGNFIRELVLAGILPGDNEMKNLGLTTYGRVLGFDPDKLGLVVEWIYKDYQAFLDEGERIYGDWGWPSEEMELINEAMERGREIFPDKFVQTYPPIFDALFQKHHGDLLTVEFWDHVKQRLLGGEVLNITLQQKLFKGGIPPEHPAAVPPSASKSELRKNGALLMGESVKTGIILPYWIFDTGAYALLPKVLKQFGNWLSIAVIAPTSVEQRLLRQKLGGAGQQIIIEAEPLKAAERLRAERHVSVVKYLEIDDSDVRHEYLLRLAEELKQAGIDLISIPQSAANALREVPEISETLDEARRLYDTVVRYA